MKHLALILALLTATCLCAQPSNARGEGAKDDVQKTTIFSDVRTWRLIDDLTKADTTTVDTILIGHQLCNPIWRRSLSNVTLGNSGSPNIPTYFPAIKRIPGFVFLNTLTDRAEQPEDFLFYDTKTPYTRISYQIGYPKRRSDELIHILFTQNVNSQFNFGTDFSISSSIGRYESMRTDHIKFRLFGSYDGSIYHAYFTYLYHKISIYENGGITDEQDVINPSEDSSEKFEDIQINLMDANNYIGRYQWLFNHALDVVHIARMDSDSITTRIPVVSAHHKFYLEKTHHEFVVEDLDDYADETLQKVFGTSQFLLNPERTSDKTKYLHLSNTFQIKMTEEFNSLLQFGLRAYISNDVRVYRWPAESTVAFDSTAWDNVYYLHNQRENRISTHVGGQIFKNRGDNFRWNAGARLCFQGHDAGDVYIDGNITTLFPLFGRAASLFASGYLSLRTPELFEEKYISNHFAWNKNFDKEKTLYAEGGLRWGDLTELKAFFSTINKRIYYAADCLPDQKNGITQLLGVYLYQMFRGAGFHSINRLALQYTSDDEVVALPTFAIYSSDFYQNKFFGVLTLQLGFDFRYNTRFYTPAYQPALMQFHAQHERRIGGYPYVDPFVNLHIKRVRFFFKYEHVNAKLGSRDYFHTIYYPSNPSMIRWGISWNFYD